MIVSLYWKQCKKPGSTLNPPLTKQLKLGISQAFYKFNEYQFAKFDSNNASVRLRDAMFLTHPKPRTEEEVVLFKKIANQELTTPDTWEVQLSAGADKKETFTRLMEENKLGALAFIRNLRNMASAGVARSQVASYAKRVNIERVLPFRFITAAKYVPQWSDIVEEMMFKCMDKCEKLSGKTVLLVDNSGSMYGPKISAKSELDRSDAAQALAILIKGICEESVVLSFSNAATLIPAHLKGFALVDAIKKSPCGGTYIGQAVAEANKLGYDRIIIITDEQSATGPGKPLTDKAYIINVATYKNGIGYGEWTHISGFSENVVEYISAAESLK